MRVRKHLRRRAEDIQRKRMQAPVYTKTTLTPHKDAMVKTGYENAIRESAVSTIDDLLGWDVTAVTAIRPAAQPEEWMSVQTWAKDTYQVRHYEENAKGKAVLDKIPDIQWWKVALLDVLTDNIDRHSGNLVVDTKRRRLVAIDNEAAFQGFGEAGSGAKWKPIRIRKIAEVIRDGVIPTRLLNDLRSLTDEDIRAAVAGIRPDKVFYSQPIAGYPEAHALVRQRINELLERRKIPAKYYSSDLGQLVPESARKRSPEDYGNTPDSTEEDEEEF